MKFYLWDKNKDKPGRKPNLWWRYTPPGHAKPAQEKCKPGVKAREAQRVELTRQIQAGTWIHPSERKASRMTFEAFALMVLEERAEKGVGKNEDLTTERGHVVNHLIPAFGRHTLPELTVFKVVKDGFDGSLDKTDKPSSVPINDKGLAGRTVRNIHSTFRMILQYAVDEGLIDTLPAPLTVKRDHLPPIVDKDPAWRTWNKFDRSEVVAFANAAAIPTCRRVALLTFFCTGPRYIELSQQRVHHYNRDGQPLNMLTVSAAKLGRHAQEGQVRHVPVLPELQLWLDWYLDEEYEILFGHRPRPTDYLFPPYTAHGKSSGVGFITHNAHHKQFIRNDLPAAGLARSRDERGTVRVDRGIHDARRTLIGLLRSARADDRLIRAMTHKGTSDNVLDFYTSWEWKALCQELSLVRFGLPHPPYRNKPIQLVPRGSEIDAVSDSPRIIGGKSETSEVRHRR